MAELDEAIEAAALAMYGTPRLAERNRDMAERAVRAAAEVIVAATRRQVAEDIEALRVEVPEDDESWDVWLSSGGWNAAIGKTAAIARGRGETDTKEQK